MLGFAPGQRPTPLIVIMFLHQRYNVDYLVWSLSVSDSRLSLAMLNWWLIIKEDMVAVVKMGYFDSAHNKMWICFLCFTLCGKHSSPCSGSVSYEIENVAQKNQSDRGWNLPSSFCLANSSSFFSFSFSALLNFLPLLGEPG